jgi:hypothetical protein
MRRNKVKESTETIEQKDEGAHERDERETRERDSFLAGRLFVLLLLLLLLSRSAARKKKEHKEEERERERERTSHSLGSTQFNSTHSSLLIFFSSLTFFLSRERREKRREEIHVVVVGYFAAVGKRGVGFEGRGRER